MNPVLLSILDATVQAFQSHRSPLEGRTRSFTVDGKWSRNDAGGGIHLRQFKASSETHPAGIGRIMLHPTSRGSAVEGRCTARRRQTGCRRHDRDFRWSTTALSGARWQRPLRAN